MNYAHDTKLQLTQESSSRAGGYTNSNAYDTAGNPTTFKGVGQTFNNANQNTASAYDGNGNPTGYKGNTLTFDVENRLTSYGSVLTAGYRADGQRAWKQNSNGKTYFFYDGDKLLYETNATGTITAKNVWADTGLLARSTSTPNRTLLYTWDAQGNVSQQLDASTGNIVESYMFDAFGTRATNGSDTAAMNDPYSGFGGSQGYYQDAETGLLLLGHRYYDPSTGRFLNRDPISYNGGVNLYEYVNNSPAMDQDPSGYLGLSDLWKLKDCLGDVTKAIGQALGHSICVPGGLCQLLINCVIGVLCALGMDLANLESPWVACAIGALCGLAHTFVDWGCEAKFCEPPSPWQVACSLVVNMVAGCGQRALGEWLGGIEGLSGGDLLKLIRKGVGGNVGIGVGEGLAEQLCGKIPKPK